MTHEPFFSSFFLPTDEKAASTAQELRAVNRQIRRELDRVQTPGGRQVAAAAAAGAAAVAAAVAAAAIERIVVVLLTASTSSTLY